MNDAKRKLCERLLVTHSVPDVTALINRTISGEVVQYHEVETIRRAMVKARKIKARPPTIERPVVGLKPDAKPYVDPKRRQKVSADEMGCRRLHDATIAMYRKAGERMRCDWAEAGVRILAGACG